MTASRDLQSLSRKAGAALNLFFKDIGQGLLVVSHNTLALVGLAVVTVLVMVFSQTELRHRFEHEALGWLSARSEARAEAEGNLLTHLVEPDAVSRATASDPRDLPRQQAAVALWLARKYKVAPEPVSRLVQEAWSVGQRAHVEPTLILAVMAVESGFNPFAQSTVGAQGLMQVLTRVHDDKYEAFGGTHAAFDPISNLRVGVLVLKESIAAAGNLDGGLRRYLGVTPNEGDRGYVNRVLAEQGQMRGVAAGRSVPPKAAGSSTAAPAKAAAVPSAPARSTADDPVLALLR